MLYALLITLALATFTAAQVVKPETGAAKRSLVSAKSGTNSFESEKGRFKIALPAELASFEETLPSPAAPRESGGKYIWDLPQGVVTIDHSDDPDLIIKSPKDYRDVREGLVGGVGVFGGKVSSNRTFRVGKYHGFQVELTDANKLQGFSRLLIVDKRKYLLFGLVRSDTPGARRLIRTALDSFRLTGTK